MTSNKKASTTDTPTTGETIAPEVFAERLEAQTALEAAQAAWSESITLEAATVLQCALAVHALEPFVGKSEAALFAEWQDVAKRFPNRNGEGVVSASTVSRWRTMGAAHAKGITPDTDARTWGRLSVNGHDGRISTVARNPKSTRTAVKKAVDACYPGGKYTSKKAMEKAAGTVDAEKGAQADPEASAPEVPQSVSAMLDTLEVIALRLSGRPVTPAEYARLAEIVATLGDITSAPVDEVEADRKSA